MKFKTNYPNPSRIRYDDTGGFDTSGLETALFPRLGGPWRSGDPGSLSARLGRSSENAYGWRNDGPAMLAALSHPEAARRTQLKLLDTVGLARGGGSLKEKA
jgi:hypothetical protein